MIALFDIEIPDGLDLSIDEWGIEEVVAFRQISRIYIIHSNYLI